MEVVASVLGRDRDRSSDPRVVGATEHPARLGKRPGWGRRLRPRALQPGHRPGRRNRRDLRELRDREQDGAPGEPPGYGMPRPVAPPASEPVPAFEYREGSGKAVDPPPGLRGIVGAGGDAQGAAPKRRRGLGENRPDIRLHRWIGRWPMAGGSAPNPPGVQPGPAACPKDTCRSQDPAASPGGPRPREQLDERGLTL